MTDLWRALDLLEDGKRWGHGNLFNAEQKTYCVLGALQSARGIDLTQVDEYPEDEDLDVLELRDVIYAQYPGRMREAGSPVADVFSFNDDLRRDDSGFEQLRAVMEKAAIRRDEILSEYANFTP